MIGLRTHDFYIGIPEMQFNNAMMDEFYPFYIYYSTENVIERYADIVTSTKNNPDLKDSLFEEGLAIVGGDTEISGNVRQIKQQNRLVFRKEGKAISRLWLCRFFP